MPIHSFARACTAMSLALLMVIGCSDETSPARDSGVRDSVSRDGATPTDITPVADQPGPDVEASCNLDGKRDPGEQCDGQDFGDKSCTDYGATGGKLTCAACQIYTTHCTGSVNCTPDALEPNDSANKGTPVTTLPFTKSGLTYCGNEDDWLKLTLEGEKTYKITVTFDRKEGDLDIYLFYAEELSNPLASSSGDNDQEVITETILKDYGGTFALLVSAVVPDTKRNVSYSIEIVEI